MGVKAGKYAYESEERNLHENRMSFKCMLEQLKSMLAVDFVALYDEVDGFCVCTAYIEKLSCPENCPLDSPNIESRELTNGWIICFE